MTLELAFQSVWTGLASVDPICSVRVSAAAVYSNWRDTHTHTQTWTHMATKYCVHADAHTKQLETVEMEPTQNKCIHMSHWQMPYTMKTPNNSLTWHDNVRNVTGLGLIINNVGCTDKGLGVMSVLASFTSDSHSCIYLQCPTKPLDTPFQRHFWHICAMTINNHVLFCYGVYCKHKEGSERDSETAVFTKYWMCFDHQRGKKALGKSTFWYFSLCLSPKLIYHPWK